MPRIAVAVTALALAAGCGTATGRPAGQPSVDAYAGPMRVAQDFSDHATVLEASGAAGQALECEGTPYAGGGGDYGIGLESVQDGPMQALDNWLDEEGWASQLPDTGYVVERADDGRVLMSFDVQGRTKIAVIAADDIRDFDDDVGWGVESWAECDPSELPATVSDQAGIGVWEDASGEPVPVTRIQSFQGAEHCDWQDITFLLLGPETDPDEYVRDTSGALSDLLRTSYDAHATLPDDASDTGYRREGRQLWLDRRHDAAYLVKIADPRDVERWPAAKQTIGCE